MDATRVCGSAVVLARRCCDLLDQIGDAHGPPLQSPRFDLSTLRLRRMYRALASGTKSTVVTGASLSGATNEIEPETGWHQPQINQCRHGFLGLESRWRYCDCFKACENVAACAIRGGYGAAARALKTLRAFSLPNED